MLLNGLANISVSRGGKFCFGNKGGNIVSKFAESLTTATAIFHEWKSLNLSNNSISSETSTPYTFRRGNCEKRQHGEAKQQAYKPNIRPTW